MTTEKLEPSSERPDHDSSHSSEVVASPSQRWMGVILVTVCCLVFAALVIPAIQRARYAAMRTQSKNNLKQLGLAFHNYHDVFGQFPIGADVRSDGTAVHGWTIRLEPYLEASPLYSKISQNLVWDHPANSYLFRFSHPAFVNPTFAPRFTSDGFGLTHYLGNPNVLHRNETVSLSDMTTGSSNNWLAGEVSGRFQPFAYPVTWRALTLPLNDGKGSYGLFQDSGQFCLADGSVRTLSEKTDVSVIQQLANAPPIATPQQTKCPIRVFEYSNTELWTSNFLLAQDEEWMRYHKGAFGTKLCFDPKGKLDTAEFYTRSDGQPAFGQDGNTRIDLHGIVEQYPEVRVIIIDSLTDAVAECIAKCPAVEMVVVVRVQVTESGRHALQGTKTLKRICMKSGEEYSPENVPVELKRSSE